MSIPKEKLESWLIDALVLFALLAADAFEISKYLHLQVQCISDILASRDFMQRNAKKKPTISSRLPGCTLAPAFHDEDDDKHNLIILVIFNLVLVLLNKVHDHVLTFIFSKWISREIVKKSPWHSIIANWVALSPLLPGYMNYTSRHKYFLIVLNLAMCCPQYRGKVHAITNT